MTHEHNKLQKLRDEYDEFDGYTEGRYLVTCRRLAIEAYLGAAACRAAESKIIRIQVRALASQWSTRCALRVLYWSGRRDSIFVALASNKHHPLGAHKSAHGAISSMAFHAMVADVEAELEKRRLDELAPPTPLGQ